MDTYVLKGESPAQLAKKYTGDSSRYVDLFAVNELTPSTDGMTGRPAFKSDEWRKGRRITIPNSWTRPGTGGRVALTDKTVGTVGYGPTLIDSWQGHHPTWNGNGTNLVYWSQVVNAAVKLLAMYPPSQDSNSARACLAKTDYWAKLYAFLKTWQKPSQFVAANSGRARFVLEPEGQSYAGASDVYRASIAAYKFVRICSPQVTAQIDQDKRLMSQLLAAPADPVREGIPGHEWKRRLADKPILSTTFNPNRGLTWDAKHPQWNGTNIDYWSQRVDADVRLMASVQKQAKEKLTRPFYLGELRAFLRLSPTPAAFEAKYIIYHDSHLVPNIWFAKPADAVIAYHAAVEFVHSYKLTLADKPLMSGLPGGQAAGPRGTVGEEGDDADQLLTNELLAQNAGKTCTPDASGEAVKPYYYIVTSEDLGSFWAIPKKFNMDPGGTGKWTWHQMRAVNTDWSPGFVNDAYGACQFRGLRVGSKLRVPASWLEPKPGVKTEVIGTNTGDCPPGEAYSGGKCVPKGEVPGIDPAKLDGDDSGSTVLALLAVVGLAAVGGVYLYKQRNKR